MIEEEKKKISVIDIIRIIIILGSTAFLFLWHYKIIDFDFDFFSVSDVGHRLTDVNDSEEKVKNYLNNYLYEKYGIKSKLTLIEKKPISFCVSTTCFRQRHIKGVFTYKFSGVDENNKQFDVVYTNSYLSGSNNYKVVIEDDYYVYELESEVNDIVPNYFDTYEIYVDNSYGSVFCGVVIKIKGDSTKKLLDLYKDISYNNDCFKIIYTTDDEIYDVLLSRDYSEFKDWNTWDNLNFLTYEFDYELLSHWNKDGKEYEDKLLQLEKNNNYTIVLYDVGETHYYIYGKEINKIEE